MTKQKTEKFATNANQDKTRQHRPLVQLTVAQLDAIAGGSTCPSGVGVAQSLAVFDALLDFLKS